MISIPNDPITVEEVKRDVNIFESLSDETVEEKIKVARLKVIKDHIATDAQPPAVFAYARHLLLGHYFASTGGVTSASTLGQQFQNVDLTKTDPFLDDYKQLVADFGHGGWKAKFI